MQTGLRLRQTTTIYCFSGGGLSRARIPVGWPYVQWHIATLTLGAFPLAAVGRWRASDGHPAACKAFGESHDSYRMHDARHSYAVRAIKAGALFEHVAAQLGHADTQMVVKVYGRYKPSAVERREWEKTAAAQDAARAPGASALGRSLFRWPRRAYGGRRRHCGCRSPSPGCDAFAAISVPREFSFQESETPPSAMPVWKARAFAA